MARPRHHAGVARRFLDWWARASGAQGEPAPVLAERSPPVVQARAPPPRLGQDLARSVASLLQKNHREEEELCAIDLAEGSARLAEGRARLLRRHRELGKGLNSQEFEELGALWREFLELERAPAQSRRSHLSESGSHWRLRQLSQYVGAFQALAAPWCPAAAPGGGLERAGEPLGAWIQMDSLPQFLVAEQAAAPLPQTGAVPPPGVDPFGEGGWTERWHGGWETALVALGVPSLGRLGEPQGREVLSRVVVDAVLMPLCERFGVVMSLEERIPASEEHPLPANVPDYVLREPRAGAPGPALGVVEVKRCLSRGWEAKMVEGVVQCCLQLLALQALDVEPPAPSHGQKRAGGARAEGRLCRASRHALLGLVSDGQRWVCLELHPEHVAIAPVLHAVDRPSLQLLLEFLSERLKDDTT